MTSAPPGGYSIPEFRQKYRISEAKYKSLKKANLAPRETRLPENLWARITPEDEQTWLELISTQKVQMAEVQRRHELAVASGRKSAQSPGHPSQVWKRFRELGLAKPSKRKRLKMQMAE
jgi:hypothetical protein